MLSLLFCLYASDLAPAPARVYMPNISRVALTGILFLNCITSASAQTVACCDPSVGSAVPCDCSGDDVCKLNSNMTCNYVGYKGYVDSYCCPKPMNVGETVGLVIGSIVGLAIFYCFIKFCCNRHSSSAGERYLLVKV